MKLRFVPLILLALSTFCLTGCKKSLTSVVIPDSEFLKTNEVRMDHKNPDQRRRIGRIGGDASPPRIVITEPLPDGRGIKRIGKRVIIRGRATDDSGVSEVLVDGREARLLQDDRFEAEVLLAVGENQIEVRATDTKGNSGREVLKIVRDPAKPVSASFVQSVPSRPGGTELPDKTGRYYALLIAVQDYADGAVSDLNHPVSDALRLKDILIRNYTFAPRNVIFMENPDRSQVIGKFEELSRKVTNRDNLLIFYAGHGYWDEKLTQGYWLPRNASKSSKASWLSNSTIRDYIRGIRTKHTLLISDACFSGGIFKTRSAFSGAPRAITELYKLPSRKAMTSGTMKEVPDRSAFLHYLTKRLQENPKKHLSSEQLFVGFRDAVINNSPTSQVPQFGVIRESGDEGGDFVFIRK